MAFIFSQLQAEVKRRATRDQGGTQFDSGIKNVINTSIWRIARSAKWRTLRRESTFTTVKAYTTGSGAVTATVNSVNVTVTGATFLTDDVHVGRWISISGSTTVFKIATITGNTTLTLNQVYDGSTSITTGTYSIYGQEDYTLPIQIDHRAVVWHKQYGWPLQLQYVPTQEFYGSGALDTIESVPVAYRMWGMNMAIEQVKAASVITISSSSSSDTSISLTVFGTVSGYPDYEVIITNASNGTTAVAGLKSFSYVERIVKGSTTVGRITCTANSANTTVSVLPVGNTTTGPYYTKLQLYPLPTSNFPINILYYKTPYELVNDGDVSELGEEFSEAIILLATAKINAEQNKKEDQDFYQMYMDEIKSLKQTNVDKPDWGPTLKRPNMGNFGGLGGRGDVLPWQIGNSGLYGWRSSRY